MQSALQVSLLVVICVWLLYQTEHSNDKKKSHLEMIKFKVDHGQFDIVKFSRKYGVGRGQVLEEDEEEGGAGDHAMDAMSPGEESDAFEEKDHDEASQKAREMSFKGDDASSGVVHVVHREEEEEEEEEEREGGSHEARERSFKADDASSAVAHEPQADELDLEPGNNGGIRNQAEDGSKDSEKKVVDRAPADSNATEGEEKASSIIFSKNSTAASTTVVQNKTTAVAVAIAGLERTEGRGDDKRSIERGVTTKQKADTIGRREKSEEM